MSTNRLKLKIGPHEFEAEGDHEQIMGQLEIWKELIKAVPASKSEAPTSPGGGPKISPAGAPDQPAPWELEKLFIHVEHDISLRYLPLDTDGKEQNAILLILYGYKQLEEAPELPVTRLKTALEKSGLNAGRIDRLAGPLAKKRWVLKRGRGKGGIYQLTNAGLGAAIEVTRELLQHIP